LRRRLQWLLKPSYSKRAVLDQFFVGAASGLLIIAIASSKSPTVVGQVGLAYSIGAVLVVLVRGGFLARLTLFSENSKILGLSARALTSFSLVAMLATLLSTLIIWGLNGRQTISLLVILMALSFPMVVAYEILRYTLVTCQRPKLPASLSLFWFLLTAVATGFAVLQSRPEIAMITWLSVGSVATLILFRDFRQLLHQEWKGSDDEIAPSGHVIPNLSHFNFVIASQAGAALVIALGVYIFAGAGVWAQIVVLHSALYPLSVLAQAMPLVVRAGKNSASPLRTKIDVGKSVVSVILITAILWFAVVKWLAPNIFATLLGETWLISTDIFWIATINMAVTAILAYVIASGYYHGIQIRVRYTLLSTALLRVTLAIVLAYTTESAGWIITGELAVNVLTLVIIGGARLKLRTAKK
jgi:hypothetical protein